VARALLIPELDAEDAPDEEGDNDLVTLRTALAAHDATEPTRGRDG
jgi:hypothetical protein